MGMKKVLIFFSIVFSLYGCNQNNLEEGTIFKEIENKFAKINSYTADCVFIDINENEQNFEARGKTWYKKPNRTRMETTINIDANVFPEGSNQKMISVCDGDTKWFYMGLFNIVEKINLKALKKDFGDKYGLVFHYLEKGQIKYMGIEELGGEKVYVFEGMQSKLYAGNKPPERIKLYLRLEDTIPVQIISYDSAGNVTGTLTSTNIKINVPIDDEIFNFTPPEGAQISDLTESRREYMEKVK